MKLQTAKALLPLLIFLAGPVLAKAPTAAVSITGPGLSQPFQTSAEAVIKAHVWIGNFANWDTVVEKPADFETTSYRVHFWVDLGKHGQAMKYVLDFQWLGDEDRGVVCLPGRDNIWYRTNTYSILRREQDGRCFYAETDWGRAVDTALKSAM